MSLPELHMLRTCVCDAGFSGHDCAARECPRGSDPLALEDRACGNNACTDEVQLFLVDGATTGTFTLTVTNAAGALITGTANDGV